MSCIKEENVYDKFLFIYISISKITYNKYFYNKLNTII